MTIHSRRVLTTKRNNIRSALDASSYVFDIAFFFPFSNFFACADDNQKTNNKRMFITDLVAFPSAFNSKCVLFIRFTSLLYSLSWLMTVFFFRRPPATSASLTISFEYILTIIDPFTSAVPSSLTPSNVPTVYIHALSRCSIITNNIIFA